MTIGNDLDRSARRVRPGGGGGISKSGLKDGVWRETRKHGRVLDVGCRARPAHMREARGALQL